MAERDNFFLFYYNFFSFLPRKKLTKIAIKYYIYFNEEYHYFSHWFFWIFLRELLNADQLDVMMDYLFPVWITQSRKITNLRKTVALIADRVHLEHALIHFYAPIHRVENWDIFSPIFNISNWTGIKNYFWFSFKIFYLEK